MTRGTEDTLPASGPTDSDPETLACYLARTGRLPVLQGLALAMQLLSALDALHRRGLVHGNVSRSSLRVSRAGALVLPSPARAGTRPPAGSPGPDLAAAAAVAYELLTGASPSRGSPAAVRELRAELPGDLDVVFGRALARRADQHFRSAADLSAALLAALPAPRWDRALPAPVPPRVEPPVDFEPAALAAVAVPVQTPREARTRLRPSRRIGVALAGVATLTVLAASLLGSVTAGGPPLQRDTDAGPQQPAAPLVLAQSALPAATPLDSGTTTAAASQDEEAAPERLSAPSAKTADRPHPAPRKPRTPAAFAGLPAREGRPHAPRPTEATRVRRQAAVRVAHSVAPGPDAACRQDMPFAPALCTAFRCATAEYRQHPVCVRMHAEAALARARLAEARGGP